MNSGNKNLEYPLCNLCNSKKHEVLMDNVATWRSSGKFRIVKCQNCGLVYQSPRPNQKEILKYYEPEHYWGTDITTSVTNKGRGFRDKVYGVIYEYIFDNVKEGSILDVGAGTGLFLTKFKEKGWRVKGVELSPEACNYAKRVNKVTLDEGDLLDQKYPDESFDVITLNGTLEHLYKPKETLVLINKLLTKDGMVVIMVPNFESVGRKLFGKEWYALQPPTHLYHFTTSTISKMLNEVRLKVVKIGHDYWVHNYYIIFESLRLNFSPKFKNSKDQFKYKKIAKNSSFSYKLELGKILARGVSFTIASLEPILKKGEVLTVYAKKA